MSEIIVMPKLGFNMSEGKLLKWYKKEGDTVIKGEALFSIETDKTSIDIEATADGVLRKVLLKEGEAVPVTLPIAIIAGEDENIDAMLEDMLSQPGEESKETVKETSILQSSSRDFDVVIIGGGPGGYVAAIKAAQMGKRTAIIEKDSFGGVCLNRGCIPTKSLLRSVQALNEVRECLKFGVTDVSISDAKLNMSKVQDRKNSIVAQLVEGVSGLLRGNGVTVINGIGEIQNQHAVKCGSEIYSTDYIIIATGSKVKSLSVPMSSKMNILTSNEVLNLTELPDSIAIIGGGVIGIEFAYFFANVGCKVTVVEFLDRILPMVDEEITMQVTKMLESKGVKIYTGAKVTEITESAVVFEKEGKQDAVVASSVLMSVGRIPYSSGIDCQGLNIMTDHGAIVTDLSLKTSVDNIYAIGDVNGKIMLAHTASMEGIIAVENICGNHAVMNYDRIPSAIYIQPEIACVGLTETQAREKHGEVRVGRFPLFANGKAKVEGEESGLIKVIVEPKYNEIVGVHLYCIHATDMISEAVVAMGLEASAEEMVNSIHPHPTISEAYHEAFHAALDKAIHFI